MSGAHIDLTPLAKLGAVTVPAGQYNYTLGICAQVPCNGSTAGGCQHISPLHSYSTGQVNSNVGFIDGDITLTYALYKSS